MIVLITVIDDKEVILSDNESKIIVFEDLETVIEFTKTCQPEDINPELRNIPINKFRISYVCASIPNLPDFIASKYEENSDQYTILDSETGEILSKTYMIVFADSNCGFFVARYGNHSIETENEYILHINKNLIIIKNSEEFDFAE